MTTVGLLPNVQSKAKLTTNLIIVSETYPSCKLYLCKSKNDIKGGLLNNEWVGAAWAGLYLVTYLYFLDLFFPWNVQTCYETYIGIGHN